MHKKYLVYRRLKKIKRLMDLKPLKTIKQIKNLKENKELKTVKSVKFLDTKDIIKIVDNHTEKPERKLVVFDIDGTLTLGYENGLIVDALLKKGYILGMCTAGSLYNPTNLSTFKWMPMNLYTYLKNINFETFSNVANRVLGEHNRSDLYTLYMAPNDISAMKQVGWYKGVFLSEMGKLQGVKPENVYIIDDSVDFIAGIKMFNPSINTICVGRECGQQVLNMDSVKILLD